MLPWTQGRRLRFVHWDTGGLGGCFNGPWNISEISGLHSVFWVIFPHILEEISTIFSVGFSPHIRVILFPNFQQTVKIEDKFYNFRVILSLKTYELSRHISWLIYFHISGNWTLITSKNPNNTAEDIWDGTSRHWDPVSPCCILVQCSGPLEGPLSYPV